MLSISLMAQADQLSDLEKLHQSCKETVNSCNKTLDLRVKYSEKQGDIVNDQQKYIEQLNKQNNNVFNSPLFYVTIGLIGGFVLVRSK